MKTITFILLLFLSPSLFSPGWKEYIAENALPTEKNLELDSSHYDSFKKYKLIMMGEMHGTLEPAKMIEQLARLILSQEDSISIGLEIPEKEMEFFLVNPSEKALKESRFFSKPNEDGRNSIAWFELVKYCMNEPRIHIFFFDHCLSSCFGNRDEWMYKRIRDQASSHPTEKILTLSGNFHNQLVQIKMKDGSNYQTTGFHCLQDTVTFPTGSICSICHYYSKGKMLNNWGEGLELKNVKNEKNEFSEHHAKNYLLFYPESNQGSPFNCVFFTRKVHHSESLPIKN